MLRGPSKAPGLYQFYLQSTTVLKPRQEHNYTSSSAIAPTVSLKFFGLIQPLTQDYVASRLLSQILPALNNSLTSAFTGALILVLEAAYRL